MVHWGGGDSDEDSFTGYNASGGSSGVCFGLVVAVVCMLVPDCAALVCG